MQNDTMTLYKLMILYFLDHVEHPLTNAQMSEFFLGKDYTDYFTIQQAISELSETELIRSETVRNSSFFQITSEGKDTLDLFQYKISADIKKDIQTFLKENQHWLREEVSTPAEYYEQKKGEFMVHCRILEHDSLLLELSLAVPSEKKAIQICDSWRERNQDVYAAVFDLMIRGGNGSGRS